MSEQRTADYGRPSRRAMLVAVIAMLLFVALVVGIMYWTAVKTDEEASMAENMETQSLPPEIIPGAPAMQMPVLHTDK